MKWEYCFVHLIKHHSGSLDVSGHSQLPKGCYIRPTYTDRLDLFNYMGQDGWELVDTDCGGYTFKRHMSED